VVDVLDFVDGLSRWEIMLCSKLHRLSNNSFFFQIPLLFAIRLPQKSTFTTLIKTKVETPDFKKTSKSRTVLLLCQVRTKTRSIPSLVTRAIRLHIPLTG
jgi:hypothetical protein